MNKNESFLQIFDIGPKLDRGMIYDLLIYFIFSFHPFGACSELKLIVATPEDV